MRSKARPTKSLVNNQEGMVAITTTLIIMILIALVVSSFALLVGREQRESLDRQLSTQAFYAAEAGVRDATDALSRNTSLVTAKNNCNGFVSDTGLAYQQDLSTNVKYSCVLINTTPNNILNTNLDPVDGSFVIPIEANTNLSKLKISWQNNNGDLQFEDSARGSSFGLPTGQDASNSALKTGMPRITLVPGFNGGNLTRQKIIDESQTLFLYPKTGLPSSVAYEPNGNQSRSTQGQFVSGDCKTNHPNDTFACASTLTGLSQRNYFLVIKPLYRPISLEVTGYDSANQKTTFSNAQAVIDSTGKATDVLRRIQVRVPIEKGPSLRNMQSLFPEAAVESTDSFCKQFQVTSGSVADLCSGTTVTHQFTDPTIPAGTTPGTTVTIGGNDPFAQGDAKITSCPPGQTCPAYGDPSAARPYNFQTTLYNASNNPMSDIQSCIWDWGDGTRTVIVPPATGCGNGDMVRHLYPGTPGTNPDLWALIQATNGAQGCRRYTPTLTMIFTPASLKPNAVSRYVADVPNGLARYPGQICYQKFVPYTP